MNRKLHLSILIFFSLILLLLCVQTRLEAISNPPAALSAEYAPEDPWYDQIFESRSFSNLVVSLTADEDDLYAEGTGILTDQYMLRGRESERPAQVFVYEPDGTPLIAQNAGLRVTGATSRSAARKSFRIVAREEYDRAHPVFTCDLWGGRRVLDGTDTHIREYSSFILHSVRLSADSTGIHNSVGYSLARKAGIADAAPTTPAAVYLNGVYQGACFLMPSKNDHALAELYHIDSHKDIDIVSVFEEEKTGTQTDPEVLEEYLSFVSWVQNCDIADPAAVAEIERQLDVEQCLEYYAVNLLLANGDWLDNNLRVWRCKDNGLPWQDGRWRYFLFDLDWVGSFPELTSLTFWQATQSYEHYNILPKLLQHPEYLERFRQIIARMEEDAFYPESIEAVFEEEEARMIDEISYDFQSDAFCSYHLYSIYSEPPAEDEYLTLEDRQYLVEDFKNHMLVNADVVNECLAAYGT